MKQKSRAKKTDSHKCRRSREKMERCISFLLSGLFVSVCLFVCSFYENKKVNEDRVMLCGARRKKQNTTTETDRDRKTSARCMAVLLETSLGFVTVDLHFEECPLASQNFLAPCQAKRYNNVLFFNVQPGFIAQAGDPTGTGREGAAALGGGRFQVEKSPPRLNHMKRGLLTDSF